MNDNKTFKDKLAYLENKIITNEQLLAIASILRKDELYSKILSCLLGPIKIIIIRIEIKSTNQQIIESLKEMSLIEVIDLVKVIKKNEFHVLDELPAAGATFATNTTNPNLVTLTFIDVGEQKVSIIKLYRLIIGLGSSSLVSSGLIPSLIAHGVFSNSPLVFIKNLLKNSLMLVLKTKLSK